MLDFLPNISPSRDFFFVSTEGEEHIPFSVKTAHALKIHEAHVITVTGKAFYDIGHAPADHSNRRSTQKDYAVCEIDPVIKIEGIP